jgi:hypothetical protein
MSDLQIQRDLNSFTRRARLGYAPLHVDGDIGPATRKRIRECKWLLGYWRNHVDGTPDAELAWRLAHSTKKSATFHVGRKQVRQGVRRRWQRRREVARNRLKAWLTPGVTTFDGVPVAKWLVPYLRWARAQGWTGRLVSGWRDPKYSEGLCLRMCGAPSCPGRCAGRASNHSGSTPYSGAVDVSCYEDFGRLMAHCPLNPKLINRLPVDPVHWSVSGR